MLTPEQKAKLKKAGYNDTQIALYAQRKSKTSFVDRTKTSFSQGVSKMGEAFSQAQEGRNPLSTGAKLGAGFIETAASPLSAALEPVIKPTLGRAVNFAGNKLADLYGENVQRGLYEGGRTVAEDVLETTADVATIADSVLGVRTGISKASNASNSAKKELLGTIDDFGEGLRKSTGNLVDRFKSPDVSEATKVSLNPVEAMKGSLQDIKVSVGGKIKNLSEVTPTEKMKIKTSTQRSLNNLTKQAEKFSKDRSVSGGSPVEIVGSRTDKALDFADRKRQVVGRKMGDIEQKYLSDSVPVDNKTLTPFVEAIKNFENPKFGMESANAPAVRKLVEDFDKLTTNGATIGERLEFIRSWDTYLRDARDAFGNFKENATVNTRIQNAIRSLKNETVDAIASKDTVYKNLRNQYRIYKELDDIGNALLGKDGALGERIKGASVIKRAIQSNSDAGARQFLTKLRDLTGYDAIKEGDLALTAMENVGDYQGLNLLNILKEGKTGLINRGLEKVQDLIVGDKAKRVEKYIKK